MNYHINLVIQLFNFESERDNDRLWTKFMINGSIWDYSLYYVNV